MGNKGSSEAADEDLENFKTTRDALDSTFELNTKSYIAIEASSRPSEQAQFAARHAFYLSSRSVSFGKNGDLFELLNKPEFRTAMRAEIAKAFPDVPPEQICLPDEAFIYGTTTTGSPEWYACKPEYKGTDDFKTFWKDFEIVGSDTWKDSKGDIVSPTAATQADAANLQKSKLTFLDAMSKATAASKTLKDNWKAAVKEVAQEELTDPAQANDDYGFDITNMIDYYTRPRTGDGAYKISQDNLAKINTLFKKSICAKGIRKGLIFKPVRDAYQQAGIPLNKVVEGNFIDLSEDDKLTIRRSWSLSLSSGGYFSEAVKYVFKDLIQDIILRGILVKNLLAFFEILFGIMLIYVWGPNLANELNRFLLSLSTCSVQLTDARTYAFLCGWAFVDDDDQFDTNATGEWCQAPDCYDAQTECPLDGNGTPASWGVFRPASAVNGGGACQPKTDGSNPGCSQTTGTTSCSQSGGKAYSQVVTAYVWQRFSLAEMMNAMKVGAENLMNGMWSWFSQNGWMLLAGILVLFIVIIPLVTHFISTI